jgi:N-sulfoglucosamine sulfohydrolase
MNILLITGDDHGVQAGCYGDQQARTPNLDRLAAQGTMFQNAYVAHSSCSSSRSSILTGKYPHETGQIGLAHLGYTMKPGQISLPVLLAKAGYKTGIIGKHHVAPFSDVPFQWSRTSDYRAKDDGQGDTSYSVYERGRLIEDVAGFASEFFEQSQKSETPFFLYLNYSDPHKPFQADVKGYPRVKFKPGDIKPFDYLAPGEATQAELADYYNCISRMDTGVGMVLDRLNDLGLRDDTLVIYLGDNGEPFPHAKATINQPGLHVPLMIDWPGRSAAGCRVKSPVSTVSIFATVLDAAGVDTEKSRPGSLRGFLDGKKEPSGPVFSEMNAHGVPQYKPQRCVFLDGYKLIIDLVDSSETDSGMLSQLRIDGETVFYKSCRLYNLEKDALEKNDLSGSPEMGVLKEKMLKQIAQWMIETNDPWLSLENARAVALAHEQSRASGDGVHWNGSAETQDLIPSLRYRK